jgi:hypothetical protein
MITHKSHQTLICTLLKRTITYTHTQFFLIFENQSVIHKPTNSAQISLLSDYFFSIICSIASSPIPSQSYKLVVDREDDGEGRSSAADYAKERT